MRGLVTMAASPLSRVSKSSAEHCVTVDNQTPVYLALSTVVQYILCVQYKCTAVQAPGNYPGW